MKKILIPIDGSERSLDSVRLLKDQFSPSEVEVYLLMVVETLEDILTKEQCDMTRMQYQSILDKVTKDIAQYKATTHITNGLAGTEILNYADTHNIDIIVMTRSTKKGLAKILGSVTSFVVKNAQQVVMVVPESKS